MAMLGIVVAPNPLKKLVGTPKIPALFLITLTLYSPVITPNPAKIMSLSLSLS